METLTCQICLNEYKHLGSHVAKAHHLTAKAYKMKFGLNINTALITSEIKNKKQVKFELHRSKYLANLKKGGNKYQFKKGKTYRHYFAKESIDKAKEQLTKINLQNEKPCPFCGMSTKHWYSHIYNAHGFLYVKKQTQNNY